MEMETCCSILNWIFKNILNQIVNGGHVSAKFIIMFFHFNIT